MKHKAFETSQTSDLLSVINLIYAQIQTTNPFEQWEEQICDCVWFTGLWGPHHWNCLFEQG